MKRLSKILGGAALFFAVIGCAFCIASLCLGFGTGDFQQILQDGSAKVSRISRQIFRDDSEKTIRNAEETELSETYTDIKKLDIDASVAQCRLIPCEGDEWNVYGYDLPSGFSCEQSGDTLRIRTDDNTFQMLGLYSETAYLEIYVPEDQILDELDLDWGVGEIAVEEGVLNCRKADIECGVGSCVLMIDVQKELKIDCGIGEVVITASGQKTDFNYDLDCGVGEIQLGNDVFSELGGEQKLDYGADKEIQAECGIGSVTILFTE